MHIAPYESAMEESLAAIYNDATHRVPHCYPVARADFAAALQPVLSGESDFERLESQAAFVATDGDAICGYIHIGIQSGDDNPKAVGIIRFLYYERGHRAAGQALLDAAETYFRDHQIASVQAFMQRYRYAFYCFSHSYLSNSLDQVEALLGFNDYTKIGGEVFLDWTDYTPDPPDPIDLSFEVKLEWKQGRGRLPGLIARAMQDDEQLGQCFSPSCGEYSNADEVQNWLFTEWLGVNEEVQGRGLGRYLLQYVRQAMHAMGYRHAGISTSWVNYRAFQFYSNYGYRVSDWTYAWARELKP